MARGGKEEALKCLEGALNGGKELDARVRFEPFIDSLEGR